MRGKVINFNPKKGYGFVKPNDGGKDVFVYQANIVMEGYRTLDPGDIVEYEIELGPKGIQARDVRKI